MPTQVFKVGGAKPRSNVIQNIPDAAFSRTRKRTEFVKFMLVSAKRELDATPKSLRNFFWRRTLKREIKEFKTELELLA